MKKFILIITITFLYIITCSTSLFAYHGDIKILYGQAYYPEVKKLISQARHSVYLYMYVVALYPENKNSPVTNLVNELLNAKERGVYVKVVLELSPAIRQVERVRNDAAYSFLKNAGVDVNYDTTGRTHHLKTVIIDRKILVVGSHNWTEGALKFNYETSLLATSKEAAEELLSKLDTIPLSPPNISKPKPKESSIAIPFYFLTNPKLGGNMATIHAYRTFDLYLYLLKCWHKSGEKTITFNFKTAAQMLGINAATMKKFRYRGEILRNLHRLQERYSLIRFQHKRDRDAKIDLLNYENKKEFYDSSKTKTFFAPIGYWNSGWNRKLSLRAKYVYLIALREDSLCTNPSGYWSHSQRRLSKIYHIGEIALTLGFRELKRYNLLEIRYGPSQPPYVRTKYKLLSLYSPEWFEQKMNKLNKFYGKEKVKLAIGYAKVILEENDLDKIESLIKCINNYGKSEVVYAINKVKRKSIHNPRRNLQYIIGIIQSRARERMVKKED